jgi:hypothetical protein
MEIDRSNTIVKKKWQFKPFQVPSRGTPLSKMKLPDDYELIIVERNGERRGFSMREMTYHHIAQGKLAGEPFLVSF